MANTDRSARVRELQGQLEREIAQLMDSDDWQAMLDVAARFHGYSPHNVMLIAMQRPSATRVAGYQRWRELGRQVRKGEKGIAILAPCVYKSDPKTDEDDGSRVVRGFKVAHVFDIRQTDGEPLADVSPTLLEGEAPARLWESLAQQVRAEGFALERGDCGGANGLTIYTERVVRVRDDVSDAQACKTLAHELAHVRLHEGSTECRGIKEVEAESVAYVVANACGLVTSTYSLPYVAHWSGGDVNAVKATAERVISTARRILESIEREEVAA